LRFGARDWVLPNADIHTVYLERSRLSAI